MLKEVTGTAQFDNKIAGMNKSIDDAQGKKRQLQEVLTQIKEKLDKLQDEIEVYNGYDTLEKDKKAFERCLDHLKIQENQAQIDELRQNKQALMAEREVLLTKREEFLRDQNIKNDGNEEKSSLEQLKNEISAIENKIMSLQ